MSKMIILGLPTDQKLLTAFGSLTIRHGQLDYALRMMIKSLGNFSIEEALNATTRQGSAELRKRIEKFAKIRFGEGQTLLKIQALLERSKRVSAKRNNFIHSLWAQKLDGDPIMRNEDHTWTSIPTTEELEELVKEILKLTHEFNQSRLDGFISEALKKQKS